MFSSRQSWRCCGQSHGPPITRTVVSSWLVARPSSSEQKPCKKHCGAGTPREMPWRRNWKDELFPLYSADGEHVLNLDGIGIDVLGIVTEGLHVTIWTTTDQGRMYWIQRRSLFKELYPGMLETAVGGGHRTGESPLEGMVREFGEEGLNETYVRERIKPCGTLTYCMSTDNYGKKGCQHQVQYVYEMELPPGVKLTPTVGEVQEFSFVMAALVKHEFKPQAVVIWLAHFIRQGIINAENEPELVEVCARLRRKHDFFVV